MSSGDDKPLIFGVGRRKGLMAVEPASGGGEMDLWLRTAGDSRRRERVRFQPYCWVSEPSLLADAGIEPAGIEPLEGGGLLRFLARFEDWKAMARAAEALRKSTGRGSGAPGAPWFYFNDPVQQYLVDSGDTMFGGMDFAELRRMQIDIETYTRPGYDFSNPKRPGDRIIAIAMADSSGWADVLSGVDCDEKELLERMVALIRKRDPDVIEGHNFFKFDWPYIKERARRHSVRLAIGRDDSVPRVRSGRFVAAERIASYPKLEIYGRHVIDTYFLVQLYDLTSRSLESFSLEAVARHFGVAAEERTYIAGNRIAGLFQSDPQRVMDYARDDILETRSIAGILSPVYFRQAQLVPFSYQNVAVRGQGGKIDALLLREYLRRRRALPRPQEARRYAGGYTDIFYRGLAKPVHHCDIRSLYPSIMLSESVQPASDELGVFLRLLDHLRDLRYRARERADGRPAGKERDTWEAMQAAYKILINSFYGYLGFSQARFNDFDAAERVTARGRELLRGMIDWLREHRALPIEIDTDGIYYLPPAGRESGSECSAFQQALRRSLPDGIEVEFDGRFRAMFSYKMKNYALLDDRGEVLIKGAALKSRGLEPFLRDFLREMLQLILEERPAELPDLYRSYADALRERRWPIEKLAKTERLQDAPATYAARIKSGGRNRNAAYELALAADRPYEAGDHVAYYVTGERKSVTVYANAKLAADWNPRRPDENVKYYIGKLDALYKKFSRAPLELEPVDSEEK